MQTAGRRPDDDIDRRPHELPLLRPVLPQGRDPLHVAAQSGQAATVRRVAQHGRTEPYPRTNGERDRPCRHPIRSLPEDELD